MDPRNKSTPDLTATMSGIDTATERLRLAAVGGIDPSVAAKLQGALGSDALQKLNVASDHIRQAASRITGASAYDQVASRLADQFKSIDALRVSVPEMPRIPEPPRFPKMSVRDIPVIQNPILETNKRLKSIEQRFSKMEEIALNAAEIATSLQSSAATFLDKFEAAAHDNDQTTKRAVKIGVLALVVAVLIPMLQWFYTEVYRAPSDTATMQGAISDITREMQSLQQTQMIIADKVADALAKNGDQVTQGLKEIRDLLAKQKEPATPPTAIIP
ncbi:hypothetical protein [Bradyrhizobium sp. G127]|uniref:hypothetical protein n=1 Tax=Bradyrhizobium sp. G127 TaxID=2904800 RepID=UPI001F23E02B|nr:hypothetical protein [Bradyrhizobium sp. G127]MCF2525419.1 hypothetical protein [Bradyrhizobium sp. G127]